MSFGVVSQDFQVSFLVSFGVSRSIHALLNFPHGEDTILISIAHLPVMSSGLVEVHCRVFSLKNLGDGSPKHSVTKDFSLSSVAFQDFLVRSSLSFGGVSSIEAFVDLPHSEDTILITITFFPVSSGGLFEIERVTFKLKLGFTLRSRGFMDLLNCFSEVFVTKNSLNFRIVSQDV